MIRARRRLSALRDSTAPAGARIIFVDAERPPPDLCADGDSGTAWVVVRHGGAPRAAEEIDLSRGGTAVRGQLRSLMDRASTQAGSTPPRSVSEAELPRISIVVPTMVARLEELRRCLDSLGQLDYPDFEVVLVDNRRVAPEPDPLVSLVDGRRSVRVIAENRPGISAARNAGVAAVGAEIVAFTDDDVQVDRRWLRAIGERFHLDPQLDVVTGLILPAELATPAQIWFERYYGGFCGSRSFAPLTLHVDRTQGPGLAGTTVIATSSDGRELRRFAIYGAGAYGAGANMAFRRHALECLGGFDPALGTGTPSRGGEDLEAMISLLWSGGTLGYEPRAIVHHCHRREYDQMLDQLRGNGMGFSAMLSSLILSDRRHLLGVASLLPSAIRAMMAQSVRRIRLGRGNGVPSGARVPAPRYPSNLLLNELRGYPSGPLAYVRSRRRWRCSSDRLAAASAA